MSQFSLRGLLPSPRARLARGDRDGRTARRPRFRPLVERMEGRALLATLRVGPGNPYATIQAAVDDADDGDTIAVDPGTYVEQVTIPSTLDNLTLRSTRPQRAIIQAPAVLSGDAAIVENDGADGLTLTGFKITGPAAGIRAGVLVDEGGSAKITQNWITDIQDVTFGVGLGIGIAVTGGSASIEQNRIDDYEKNGILVDGDTGPTFASISRNTVTGVGLNDLIAQNGIQISRGALARVDHNDVSDNLFEGDAAAAAGIILVDPGPTLVNDNDIEDNDVGIGVVDTELAVINDNKISDSTDDGIQLLGDTSLVVVSNNDSKKNGIDGIFVAETATGNLIIGNKFRNNGFLDAEDLSTGSGTAGTGNLWINNKGKTDNRGGRLLR